MIPKPARVSTLKIITTDFKSDKTQWLSLAALPAEKAVLGAILQDNGVLASIATRLRASDFFLLKHGYLYTAMERIINRGAVADLVTVSAELPTLEGWGETVDSQAVDFYLIECLGLGTSVKNIFAYVQQVKSAALRLRLASAGMDLQAAAADPKLTDVELISLADSLLAAASERIVERKSDLPTLVSGLYDRIIQSRDDGTTGIEPSGFRFFDAEMGGFAKQGITVIAGPPGIGKTATALSFVRQRGKSAHILYLSGEQSEEELTAIFTAMEARIPHEAVLNRKMTTTQLGRFTDALEEVIKYKVDFVTLRNRLTPAQVRIHLAKFYQENPIDLLVIDGLWHMHGDYSGNRRPPERHVEYEDIMAALGELVGDYDIPLMLIHQFKRDNYGKKRNNLSALAGSAAIERDAHTVLMMMRETYSDRFAFDDNTYLEIMKARGKGSMLHKRYKMHWNEERGCYDHDEPAFR